MLGLWRVKTVEVAGTEFYQVYRNTDAIKQPIETRGGYYASRDEAEALARRLNTEANINECVL